MVAIANYLALPSSFDCERACYEAACNVTWLLARSRPLTELTCKAVVPSINDMMLVGFVFWRRRATLLLIED